MTALRRLAAALCLAGLLCAPALAAKINPDGTVAPAGEPDLKALTPEAVETLKKAAAAQGDISPHTVKALQGDPKATELLGRTPAGTPAAGSTPAPAPAPAGKSGKAIYGDIIIHK